MASTSFDDRSIKRICIGLLAHVDAGKTTLSEDILYHTGVIRTKGRVDHRDTFFDTDSRERKRGITIFSKEAVFQLGDKSFTLMDTPGHTDFSAEMERVLSVLDYAVLIVSASDGVQSHTRTLWRLLIRYGLPTFVFVNKMDMEGTDKIRLMQELRHELSEYCLDMSSEGCLEDPSFLEELSLCDEALMENYLSLGRVDDPEIIRVIRERKLFPVIFGSALRDQGIDRLLHLMEVYTDQETFSEEFSARVYKITRDQSLGRLTHMKITGGSLRVKDSILLPAYINGGDGTAASGEGDEDPGKPYVLEKAERIRQYSGERFIELSEAEAGMVVAVGGLRHTRAGMDIGSSHKELKPLLVPLFDFAIIPPFDVDRKQLYLKLKELEEEISELLLSYDAEHDEIHARLMGDVQNEVLRDLISERFGVDVQFGEGSVIYKETIGSAVEGVGHYEPLRHYAEVHLLLEPGERGSGIEVQDLMGEGRGLSGNYRRLILTHILEKEHKGVLTGSGLTDVRISLVAGRSHDKHTEGGDFREATYRAIRQGLMYADNVLLEPYYRYELRLPSLSLGRAINDIQRMCGSFEVETLSDTESLLRGRAPVSLMKNYASELMSYTKGLGRLNLEFDGYDRCHDPETAVRDAGYDPETDVLEPVGSVFCSHGAGYYVPWNEVYGMMHLPFAADVVKDQGIPDKISPAFAHTSGQDAAPAASASEGTGTASSAAGFDYMGHGYDSDKELMGIFRKTFGLTKSERYADKADDELLMRESASGRKKWGGSRGGKGRRSEGGQGKPDPRESSGPDFVEIKDRKKSYLLVDGYNIIFAWEELSELAKLNLDSARVLLMDILSNYQGYKGMNLILVFDAYRVKGGQRKIEKYHNIYVVYTEEAETADKYIEKTVHNMDKKHDVTVATSDGLEQIIVFGEGAARLSARELYDEVMKASDDMRRNFLEKRTRLWNTVLKDQD